MADIHIERQHGMTLLDARNAGFLLGAFKDKIEGEIVKNLDALIDKKPARTKKPATKKPPVKNA